MDRSLLVKLFGFPATLIHGDATVSDRWQWLRKYFPPTRNGERVLEVGCGTGAFSIGAALRGYQVVGLSWDERNQRVASERAEICGATNARFEVVDVRQLERNQEFLGSYDIVVACEVIEHVLDDLTLVRNAAACLKPGGRLLLTTPNIDYIAIAPSHMGPFSEVEDGGHVRKGYSEPMLTELCKMSGLDVASFAYCSGVLSQSMVSLQYLFSRIHPIVGWASVLPLRMLLPRADRLATFAIDWPCYSICLEAYKPRFDDLESASERTLNGRGLAGNEQPRTGP